MTDPRQAKPHDPPADEDVLAEAVEEFVVESADEAIGEAAVEAPEAAEPAPESSAERSPAEAELAQTKERWLRAMAELENLRKRSRRELQTSTNLAKVNVVRELLEVLDNFGRGLDSAPWEHEDETVQGFAEGVRLIYQQFTGVLRQLGLRPIEARGAPFDPNLHEAISQIESDDVESQHVVEVVQEGYVLGDMVVRPARVVVAV